MAAQEGHVRVVQMLITYGAPISARNSEDENVLDIAIQYDEK